jgi:hypothetical protein
MSDIGNAEELVSNEASNGDNGSEEKSKDAVTE